MAGMVAGPLRFARRGGLTYIDRAASGEGWMKTVNIHAAKTHLSRLLDEAAAGDEIIIARAGKPVARLVQLDAKEQGPRVLGSLAGQFSIPDDFDAPLPDWLLDQFEGR